MLHPMMRDFPLVFVLQPEHPWASSIQRQILSHPAMQDWERQALAEPQREVGHEAEIAAVATVTADFRAG